MNAPWRRVVRTVRIAEGQFYDELECGHRESYDCTAKKRRCRTCADPTFPGISIAPRNPLPPIVDRPVVDGPTSGEQPGMAPDASSPSIPLVLTVAEVAKLLRLNVETVYAAAATGEIPEARRIGRCFRFYGPAVAKWLETGGGTGRRRGAGRLMR
jgi:excisionase family DNA binding protein